MTQSTGYAFGLRDVVLRAKYSLLKGDVIDVSGAFLTQLATGNHQDFLGTGATTLRPFLVLSRNPVRGADTPSEYWLRIQPEPGPPKRGGVRHWCRCRHLHLDCGRRDPGEP